MGTLEIQGLEALIPRLETAGRLRRAHAITEHVKGDLAELIAARTLHFPDRFRKPGPTSYARRLVHRDTRLGFTAILMAND